MQPDKSDANKSARTLQKYMLLLLQLPFLLTFCLIILNNLPSVFKDPALPPSNFNE